MTPTGRAQPSSACVAGPREILSRLASGGCPQAMPPFFRDASAAPGVAVGRSLTRRPPRPPRLCERPSPFVGGAARGFPLTEAQDHGAGTISLAQRCGSAVPALFEAPLPQASGSAVPALFEAPSPKQVAAPSRRCLKPPSPKQVAAPSRRCGQPPHPTSKNGSATDPVSSNRPWTVGHPWHRDARPISPLSLEPSPMLPSRPCCSRP